MKPLAFLFLAMQLLLAIPASASTQGTQQSACAAMPGMHANDHCPCCPDGVSSLKDCLASCTLAATMAAVPLTIAVVRSHDVVIPASSTLTTWAADPPLKPPPIT